MMHIHVILGDKDTQYIQKLSAYLSSEGEQIFIVNSFSDETYLIQFLKEHPTDLLLLSEEFYHLVNPKDYLVILLVNNPRSEELKNLPAVLKFQKGSELVTQIKEIFCNLSTQSVIHIAPVNTTCIGAFSPCGGTGKSITSLALARHLSSLGKKTLLISLEEFCSLGYLLRDERCCNLTEALFHASKHPERIVMKLEFLVGKEPDTGLHYLLPERGWIMEEEILSFIDLLKASGGYEFLVIDFMGHCSKLNYGVMDLCNTILLLTNGSAYQKFKMDAFLGQVGRTSELLSKCRIVLNKTSQTTEEYNQVELEGVIRIPYGGNMPQLKGSHTDLNTTVDYQEAIKVLGKEVMGIGG